VPSPSTAATDAAPDVRAAAPADPDSPTSGVARCEPLRRTGPPTRRSVVFVLADTLRRDRLGIYGGPAATPAFDRFASEAILFTEASSQAPWTKPSVATLFTGRLPSSHGVVSHPDLTERTGGASAGAGIVESDVLAESAITLAEHLSMSDYRTAAFVSNPWLQRRLGFGQGFELYDEHLAANATPGEVVTRAGLAWLEEQDAEAAPFFLYLHYMDPHAPFQPLPAEAIARRRAGIVADDRPVSAEAARKIAALARAPDGVPVVGQDLPASIALMELLYDQGVERFDRALDVLLRQLRRLDPEREWAIVVTSDHGEALYDRGWGEHGYALFEDEVGIPLAMRLPGVETEGPIDCAVGLVDLLPTLCDYLGLDCPAERDGRSMFADAIADPGRRIWMEGAIAHPEVRAVRDAHWKLIAEPTSAVMEIAGSVAPALGRLALFDLDSDPGERHDLVPLLDADPTARGAFARLRGALEARPLRRHPSEDGPRVRLDATTRARLEALGYVDPAEGDVGPDAAKSASPTEP
jgi:arylsulfatase A-like enzyme